MKKSASLILCVILAFSVAGCSGGGKTFTLSYSFDGTIYELEVKPNSLYRLETVPEKTGYSFLGLFDARDGGTQYVDETGIATEKYSWTENTVLYPQFAPKQYIYTLDYGVTVPASAPNEISVTYDGEIIGLPLDIKIDHKEFSGWYTGPDGTGVQITDATGVLPSKKTFDAATYPLPASQKGTFYAYYTDIRYTVTYCFSASERRPVQGIFGDSVNDLSPTCLVGERYVAAWSTQENDTEKRYAVTTVTGDMTVYPCELGNGIFFHNTGDKEIPKIVAPAGASIKLPTPEMENYIFVGWYYDGALFDIAVMPDRLVTDLQAQWDKKPVTITLNENGGGECDDISQKSGTELHLPSCSRDGYRFAGWYTADGEKFDGDVAPERDITLIARWRVEHSVTKVLTSGEKQVASEGTGILFTVSLSEYLGAESETEIYVSASYNLEVKNHTTVLVEPPHWFSFRFYDRNQVNAAYMLGECECTWDKRNNTAYAVKSFSATLSGNTIYIAAQSNTWWPGYGISDFRVTVTFAEDELLPVGE